MSFQSAKQRERAEEEHICVSCMKNGDCIHQGDMERKLGWILVLSHCQNYDEEK